MRPTTRRSIASMPRARPTPSTAPTNVCVVEIGMPVPDAITIVVAAASSAAKPRLGVSCVIFSADGCNDVSTKGREANHDAAAADNQDPRRYGSLGGDCTGGRNTDDSR